jgi:hypothetical protein
MAIFIDKYLQVGRKNTISLKNDTQLMRTGPWVAIPLETEFDRFYLGDFTGAEYTIFVDLDTQNKEMLKILVVASLDKATLTVFGRSNLGNEIVSLSATVNDSYVSLKATPSADAYKNSKLVYNAFYFQNQNLLVPY